MEGVARDSETRTSPERHGLPGMRDPFVLEVVSLLIEQVLAKRENFLRELLGGCCRSVKYLLVSLRD
jgi:hypothetical protein